MSMLPEDPENTILKRLKRPKPEDGEPHRVRAIYISSPVEHNVLVDITATIECKVAALRAHGYDEALIEKLCWANWASVLGRTLPD